jgi:hypothetical protein
MSVYLQEIKEAMNKLLVVSIIIDNKELIQIVFKGLSREYNAFCFALLLLELKMSVSHLRNCMFFYMFKSNRSKIMETTNITVQWEWLPQQATNLVLIICIPHFIQIKPLGEDVPSILIKEE